MATRLAEQVDSLRVPPSGIASSARQRTAVSERRITRHREHEAIVGRSRPDNSSRRDSGDGGRRGSGRRGSNR